MAKTALGLQKFLHGKLFFWLVGQAPHALLHLVQGPHAGVHGQLADAGQVLGGIDPAPGAGGEHVEEAGALGIDGLVGFLVQVLEVGGKGGLAA